MPFLAIDLTKGFFATFVTRSKIPRPLYLRLQPLGAAL